MSSRAPFLLGSIIGKVVDRLTLGSPAMSPRAGGVSSCLLVVVCAPSLTPAELSVKLGGMSSCLLLVLLASSDEVHIPPTTEGNDLTTVAASFPSCSSYWCQVQEERMRTIGREEGREIRSGEDDVLVRACANGRLLWKSHVVLTSGKYIIFKTFWRRFGSFLLGS